MTHISDERLAEMLAELVRDLDKAARNETIVRRYHVTAAEKALAALRTQGGVRVKPLEWDELNDGKTFRALLPIIGSIRVEPYGVCGWWEVLWSIPGQCDKLVPDVFDTPEEAKSAAQADYERRILSSLEASPAPVSEEIIAQVMKLEEACNSARTALAGMTSAETAIYLLDCRPLGVSAALAAKGGQ